MQQGAEPAVGRTSCSREHGQHILAILAACSTGHGAPGKAPHPALPSLTLVPVHGSPDKSWKRGENASQKTAACICVGDVFITNSKEIHHSEL